MICPSTYIHFVAQIRLIFHLHFFFVFSLRKNHFSIENIELKSNSSVVTYPSISVNKMGLNFTRCMRMSPRLAQWMRALFVYVPLSIIYITYFKNDGSQKITLTGKGLLPCNTVAFLSIGLLFVFMAAGQIYFRLPGLFSFNLTLWISPVFKRMRYFVIFIHPCKFDNHIQL